MGMFSGQRKTESDIVTDTDVNNSEWYCFKKKTPEQKEG